MQSPHRARPPARRNLDPMRRYLAIAAAVSSLCCSIVPARSDEVPNIDVRPICHGIASQSGESLSLGLTEQFQKCVTSEQEVHQQLKTEWRTFSAADKRHCVSLVKVGGEASYTELLTCLEMARDARALKSERSAPSGSANVDKPSGPAPSTRPPPTAGAPPTAIKPSEPTPELQRQIEQARTDADTAKKSNEEALRKVADAEAALRQEKEEVDRLKTEAERAKADAQSAKIAQASLERKLAEMESPRQQKERRAAVSETAERRLRIILITLSFVIGALAVAVVYLWRKVRAGKARSELETPGVVPESNGADAME